MWPYDLIAERSTQRGECSQPGDTAHGATLHLKLESLHLTPKWGRVCYVSIGPSSTHQSRFSREKESPMCSPLFANVLGGGIMAGGSVMLLAFVAHAQSIPNSFCTTDAFECSHDLQCLLEDDDEPCNVCSADSSGDFLQCFPATLTNCIPAFGSSVEECGVQLTSYCDSGTCPPPRQTTTNACFRTKCMGSELQ